jgi:hypothetical protein
MSLTHCENIELAGMEFDITAEFLAEYVDDSFSHEFGIEKCGHWEVTEIEYADFDCDPAEVCTDYIRDAYPFVSRKRLRKMVRQRVRAAVRALDSADLMEILDVDSMEEQAANQ